MRHREVHPALLAAESALALPEAAKARAVPEARAASAAAYERVTVAVCLDFHQHDLADGVLRQQ